MNPIVKISLWQSDSIHRTMARFYREGLPYHTFHNVGILSVERLSGIVYEASVAGHCTVRPFLSGLGWVAERVSDASSLAEANRVE